MAKDFNIYAKLNLSETPNNNGQVFGTSLTDNTIDDVADKFKILSEFTEDEWSELVQTKELGTQGDFSEEINTLRAQIPTALAYFGGAKELIYKDAHELSYVNSYFHSIFLISDFKDKPSEQKNRDQISGTIDRCKNSFRTQIAPRAATSMVLGDQELDNIRQRYKNELGALSSARKEVETLTAQVREVSGEAGVHKEAQTYETASETYEKNSGAWLAWVIAFSFVLVAVVFEYDDLYTRISPKEVASDSVLFSIQYLSTKIIIVGTILLLLLLARKNYTVARQNYIVNKHRANALSTYKTIVDASPSEQDRAIILQAATNTIFGNQDTGLEGANKGSDSPTVNLNLGGYPSN